MKFKGVVCLSDSENCVIFAFEEHDAYLACIGDQVWSDGQNVHIYDYAEREIIHELIDMVSNKKAFKGAVRRMGLL